MARFIPNPLSKIKRGFKDMFTTKVSGYGSGYNPSRQRRAAEMYKQALSNKNIVSPVTPEYFQRPAFEAAAEEPRPAPAPARQPSTRTYQAAVPGGVVPQRPAIDPSATLDPEYYAQRASGSRYSPDEVTNFLETRVFPLTDAAGIPRALAAAQWVSEGPIRKTGEFYDPTTNNPWGLMYGGQVHPYQSLDNATKAYVRTITNLLQQRGYNISEMDAFDALVALQTPLPEGNPMTYEGHNVDPYTYVQNVSRTPEWRYYYGR